VTMPTRVRSFYIITTIAAETGSNLQARLSNTGAALPRPYSKGHQAIEDAERRNTRTAAINISRTLKRFLGHRQKSLVPGFSSTGPFDFLGLRPMIDSNSRRLSQAPASLPEHVGSPERIRSPCPIQGTGETLWLPDVTPGTSPMRRAADDF
jgi:hypothetical protein